MDYSHQTNKSVVETAAAAAGLPGVNLEQPRFELRIEENVEAI